MTPITMATAAVINSRMTSEAKDRMRKHSGASIGLRAGFIRMCFRIEKDGSWKPISSLIDADVEMEHSTTGDIKINGGGALLKDLNEITKDWTPQKTIYDMLSSTLGARAAENAVQAAEQFKEIPTRCGLAASHSEVAEFIKRVGSTNKRTNDLEQRLSRLEKSHVR